MYNVPVTIMLVRKNLLSLSHLDASLARQICEMKPLSVEFLADLVKEMVASEPPIAYRSDFASSLSAVSQVLASDPSHKVSQDLAHELDMLQPYEKIYDDNVQLRYMFSEWVHLYMHAQSTEKTFATFVTQLHHSKILCDTASFTAFLRTCIEISVAEYEAMETEMRIRDTRAEQGYISVDALAKLIVTLVKHRVEGSSNISQPDLLRSILSLIIVLFNHYYETTGENFPQKLFFRLFSTMLYEFKVAQSELEGHNENILFALRYVLIFDIVVLYTYCYRDCFLVLRPAHFPAFTLCWMTIVSHRFFMPQLLLLPNQAGWPEFVTILETMLEYLGTLLNQKDLPMVVRILYRGVLRTVLILHHDFPEFLAQYHFLICEAIPPTCVQLRNLILSAYPPSTSDVPDPFRQNLRFENLPEMAVSPRVSGDVFRIIREAGIQNLLQNSLKSPVLDEDVLRMVVKACESEYTSPAQIKYDAYLPLINGTVLFIGMHAVEANMGEELQMDSMPVVLLRRLCFDLSIPGKFSCD